MAVEPQPEDAMVPDYRPEPLTDFADATSRAAMTAAIDFVRSRLGASYDLSIGGERVATRGRIRSVNPCRPSEVVGLVARGGREDAERAIQAAAAAFPSWARTAPEARARVLWRAAAILRRRRLELAAWEIFEVAKSWPEADADVAEAIDFLEFYGREMVRLAGPQPLARIAGEDNELTYIPLGPVVVIPPWNFPLAILAGMTSAALVAGNTVVLKPASTAPVIAAKFVEIMDEAGLPPGVLQFCPGGGGEIGDALVTHPLVRAIAFTGSKEVGLRIHELAAKATEGQKWIKRTILEMGGKDAIVVDENVDVDEVAAGIVASAFGFQGQKCSACSRAIIHEKSYAAVAAAVAERAEALRVGDVTDPRTEMGAVIDEAQFEKVLSYIEIGRSEGKLLAGGRRDAKAGEGWFIRPTVFGDVARGARISREEIFGPVLALERAASFEDAVARANDTEYGLTGAVYSRDRARLEYARREFHVGNLYLNRKCTGAIVGVHPFGGFNMSGTDSKAGGRDYLLLFTQAKVVSERF
jgi:1-pyrroline-5-carboxylate dehydrogenase